MNLPRKPLNRKAYGSIGHLPSSRLGPGDHRVTDGQARICTVKPRDQRDKIIVQQKYDGSCVAVAKINGEIMPLGRAGYPAITSKYEQHRLFHDWAWRNRDRFLYVLNEGERIVGEWLAQAHGTRYEINSLLEPFVAFDIMREDRRMPFDAFVERLVCGSEEGFRLLIPSPLSSASVIGYGSIGVEDAMEKACNPWAKDPVEGVVYRVERNGEVDFLAKHVRSDKVDGCYLPEISGKEAVWNWRPE